MKPTGTKYWVCVVVFTLYLKQLITNPKLILTSIHTCLYRSFSEHLERWTQVAQMF